MVKRDVVGRKLARAESLLSDARALFKLPRKAFLAERAKYDLATFYLFLAIQECIDLAAHWVAEEGWGPPDEAGATFEILAERKAIPRALATRLRHAAGLRNLIAHDYAVLDPARLHREFRQGSLALTRFLEKVAVAAKL